MPKFKNSNKTFWVNFKQCVRRWYLVKNVAYGMQTILSGFLLLSCIIDGTLSFFLLKLPSSYFSISLKKVSLSFKRSPKNLQLLKGMKIEAALRVKREKQIAHICSDDDAKKCLLINLIMVINCHQIPLLRWVHWASENSKPANVF